MSEQPNTVGIYVLSDGGCLNMQKPVTERHMYGTFMVGRDGKWVESTVHPSGAEPIVSIKHRYEYGVQDGWASAPFAELLTLNYGLSYLVELSKRTDRLTAVTFMCDSQTALSWAQGTEPAKKVSGVVLNEWRSTHNLLRQLKEKGVKVEFAKVGEAWVKSQIGH